MLILLLIVCHCIATLLVHDPDVINATLNVWYHEMPFLAGIDTVPMNWRVYMEDKKNKNRCYSFSYSNDFGHYKYFQKILDSCALAGDVCQTDQCGTPGPFVRNITKKWDCKKLWMAEVLDIAGIDAHPPEWDTLPLGIQQHYLYGDRVKLKVRGKVYDDKYYGKTAKLSKWSTSHINTMIEQAEKGVLHGPYGIMHARMLRETLMTFGSQPTGRPMRALVVGSEHPWVEAIALSVGFAHVTTLEYGSIECADIRIDTVLPSDFRRAVLEGTFSGSRGFDAVISFSSLEHPGLGRYGDAINPYGDLIMLARLHCVTKKGGRLFLGVPMARDFDGIYFNAHRIYGPVMLPQLIANWQQVAGPKEFPLGGDVLFSRINQPVLVLQK